MSVNHNRNQAVSVSNELRVALEESKFVIEGHEIKLTASFGVASICKSRIKKMQKKHQDTKKSCMQTLLKGLVKKRYC